MDDSFFEAVIENNFNGEASVFLQGAEFMIRNYPVQLEAISKSIDARDSAVLERSSHTLKGSAMYFDFADLVALAKDLEKMGRDKVWENADSKFDQLKKCAAEAIKSLTNYCNSLTTEPRPNP